MSDEQASRNDIFEVIKPERTTEDTPPFLIKEKKNPAHTSLNSKAH
jgi:hypothetical protein